MTSHCSPPCPASAVSGVARSSYCPTRRNQKHDGVRFQPWHHPWTIRASCCTPVPSRPTPGRLRDRRYDDVGAVARLWQNRRRPRSNRRLRGVRASAWVSGERCIAGNPGCMPAPPAGCDSACQSAPPDPSCAKTPRRWRGVPAGQPGGERPRAIRTVGGTRRHGHDKPLNFAARQRLQLANEIHVTPRRWRRDDSGRDEILSELGYAVYCLPAVHQLLSRSS